MTSARRATTHRRVRAARKPVVAGLAATAALVGAWYATAGASTTAAGGLSVTTASVSLPAEFPYLSAGYNNTREWTR